MSDQPCRKCHGTGRVYVKAFYDPPMPGPWHWVDCGRCDGSGIEPRVAR